MQSVPAVMISRALSSLPPDRHSEGVPATTSSDLHRIAVAGIAVNLLLLVLFLRALVAPLYLLASSILTLTPC